MAVPPLRTSQTQIALMDQRARLLRAAVGFALVPPTEPELRVLHRWLGNWRGIGDIVTGAVQRAAWEVLNTNTI